MGVVVTLGLSLAAVLCLAASVVLIRREPRRMVNGFLIEAAILLLFMAFASNASSNAVVFAAAEVLLLALDVLLFVLALALIANFVYVVRREGLSLPNVLPLAFGLLTIFVGMVGYVDATSGISGSKFDVFVMSVLFNVTLYVPLAIGAVLIYSIVYLLLPKNEAAAFIVVLGCSIRADGSVTPLLKGRLDCALSWWRAHGRQARFITSGGQGADEVVSEAQAMRDYLVAQGVPEKMVLMEDASTNTHDNLVFSQRVAQGNGGGPLLICTSNYHVLRAVLLAKSCGIPAQGIGGRTAPYYLPVAFFREYIAFVFGNKLLVVAYVALAVLAALPDLLA